MSFNEDAFVSAMPVGDELNRIENAPSKQKEKATSEIRAEGGGSAQEYHRGFAYASPPAPVS